MSARLTVPATFQCTFSKVTLKTAAKKRKRVIRIASVRTLVPDDQRARVLVLVAEQVRHDGLDPQFAPGFQLLEQLPEVPVVALAHRVLVRGPVGLVDDLPADGLEVDARHAASEAEEAGDRLARKLRDLLDAVDGEDQDLPVG